MERSIAAWSELFDTKSTLFTYSRAPVGESMWSAGASELVNAMLATVAVELAPPVPVRLRVPLTDTK